MLKTFLSLLLLTTIATGCKEDPPGGKQKGDEGTYFSMRRFAQDQWNNHLGEPILLMKTVRVNEGKIDTSYASSDTLNWGEIFAYFFKAEICDPEYLDRYKFSQFEDDMDDTYNFFYEALEKDLYTRKLLLTTERENMMAKGVYVEAVERSLLEDKVLKLYYKPMKRIQIQVTETPVFGEKKHTVTEYEFMR